MKKITYIILAASLLFFAYCKTTTKTETTSLKPVAVKPAYIPSSKQMEVAEKRWPGTTISEVQDGEAIYKIKCIECHIAFDILEFGEKKWIREIEQMAPKAKLTAEEKLKLTKHILSYREANATAKTN